MDAYAQVFADINAGESDVVYAPGDEPDPPKRRGGRQPLYHGDEERRAANNAASKRYRDRQKEGRPEGKPGRITGSKNRKTIVRELAAKGPDGTFTGADLIAIGIYDADTDPYLRSLIRRRSEGGPYKLIENTAEQKRTRQIEKLRADAEAVGHVLLSPEQQADLDQHYAKQHKDLDYPAGTKLEVHSLAQMLDPLEPAELQELVDDIREHGLREPVRIFEGQILDGRNRHVALLSLNRPIPYVEFTGTVAEAEAYVISANIRRRHLTQEQKRNLIARLLKQNPEQSDRAIAATVGASPTTVGTVRASTVQTGQLPPRPLSPEALQAISANMQSLKADMQRRIGRDGKTRRQPVRAPSATTPVMHGPPPQSEHNPQTADTRKAVRLVPWDRAEWKAAFSTANWWRTDLQALRDAIDEIINTLAVH